MLVCSKPQTVVDKRNRGELAEQQPKRLVQLKAPEPKKEVLFQPNPNDVDPKNWVCIANART